MPHFDFKTLDSWEFASDMVIFKSNVRIKKDVWEFKLLQYLKL